MNFQDVNELCDVVRETSFAIHCYHRNGHLEKVYENALAHRLRKQGISVKQQHPLTVYDEDGMVLGEYFADLLVEDRLIVELKAVKEVAGSMSPKSSATCRSSRLETGLLINFGSSKLHVKKYLLTQTNLHFAKISRATKSGWPREHKNAPKLKDGRASNVTRRTNLAIPFFVSFRVFRGNSAPLLLFFVAIRNRDR